MDNPGGSLTSLGAANLRAVHQLLDGEPKLLRDPVVVRLLDPHLADHIRNEAALYREPGLMGLRSHIVLRSRYAEDRLAQAYARGIRQYLLLGAGLDTFAWRQPPGLEDLRIFEADHPATQTQKIQRLSQAGIETPGNVRFVPVNFETESLEEALRRSDFDLTHPVFISWLGVTVYLSMEAIDAVFNFVVTLPPSSEMVFTFAQKRPLDAIRPTALRAAEAGEPWKTYIRPEELGWKLAKMGFSSLYILPPEEARELYYKGREDGLPPPQGAGIASVIV
jgi:methyltransferase (TIGR00027 family)